MLRLLSKLRIGGPLKPLVNFYKSKRILPYYSIKIKIVDNTLKKEEKIKLKRLWLTLWDPSGIHLALRIPYRCTDWTLSHRPQCRMKGTFIGRIICSVERQWQKCKTSDRHIIRIWWLYLDCYNDHTQRIRLITGQLFLTDILYK